MMKANLRRPASSASSNPHQYIADGHPLHGQSQQEATPTTSTCFEINLPLAGFSPDDVKISIQNGMLFIRCRSEKKSFERRFRLVPNLDTSALTSRFVDGILSVTVPYLRKSREATHYGPSEVWGLFLG